LIQYFLLVSVGNFPLFTIPIPKENSVGNFGIVNLAGTLFHAKGGHPPPFGCIQAPFLRNIGVPAKLFKNGVPAKSSARQKNIVSNTNRNTNHEVPVTYQYRPDSQYWYGISMSKGLQ
jgi:hypothetical protein